MAVLSLTQVPPVTEEGGLLGQPCTKRCCYTFISCSHSSKQPHYGRPVRLQMACRISQEGKVNRIPPSLRDPNFFFLYKLPGSGYETPLTQGPHSRVN